MRIEWATKIPLGFQVFEFFYGDSGIWIGLQGTSVSKNIRKETTRPLRKAEPLNCLASNKFWHVETLPDLT